MFLKLLCPHRTFLFCHASISKKNLFFSGKKMQTATLESITMQPISLLYHIHTSSWQLRAEAETIASHWTWRNVTPAAHSEWQNHSSRQQAASVRQYSTGKSYISLWNVELRAKTRPGSTHFYQRKYSTRTREMTVAV